MVTDVDDENGGGHVGAGTAAKLVAERPFCCEQSFFGSEKTNGGSRKHDSLLRTPMKHGDGMQPGLLAGGGPVATWQAAWRNVSLGLAFCLAHACTPPRRR